MRDCHREIKIQSAEQWNTVRKEYGELLASLGVRANQIALNETSSEETSNQSESSPDKCQNDDPEKRGECLNGSKGKFTKFEETIGDAIGIMKKCKEHQRNANESWTLMGGSLLSALGTEWVLRDLSGNYKKRESSQASSSPAPSPPTVGGDGGTPMDVMPLKQNETSEGAYASSRLNVVDGENEGLEGDGETGKTSGSGASSGYSPRSPSNSSSGGTLLGGDSSPEEESEAGDGNFDGDDGDGLNQEGGLAFGSYLGGEGFENMGYKGGNSSSGGSRGGIQGKASKKRMMAKRSRGEPLSPSHWSKKGLEK